MEKQMERKNKFISELFEDKKLRLNQKKRAFNLSINELKRTLKDINEEPDLINRETLKIEKKHSPKEMISFLFGFSKDEQYKWFTHEPDLRVNKIEYNSLLSRAIKNIGKKYSNLNIQTTDIISSFLSKKNFYIYYPEFESPYAYSSEEVKEKIDLGMNPFEIVVNGIHFSDIIYNFKRAIEFRLDYGEEFRFSYLIRKFVTDTISVDYKERYTEDFRKIGRVTGTYIDMNNFFRGLRVVIDWLNSHKNLSSELDINLEDKDDSYILTLFHKGSYFGNEAKSEKMKGISGDLVKLRKLWFSIVDLEIQADLINKGEKEPYSIICLNNATKMIIEKGVSATISENVIKKLDREVGGVKYLIKIYKTINL